MTSFAGPDPRGQQQDRVEQEAPNPNHNHMRVACAANEAGASPH